MSNKLVPKRYSKRLRRKRLTAMASNEGTTSGGDTTVARGNRIVYRGLNFMPPIFQTKLRFSKQITMVNVASGWTNIRFSPTAAFDVDPVIGSTAMPGFTELAGIYRFYRVRGSAIKADFGNLDALAGIAVVCPVNFDPTSNTTLFQQYLSSRSARMKPLGLSTGAGTAQIVHRLTDRDFGGALSVAIDTYTASVTAIPTNNIWWLVGAYLSAIQTNGVFVAVEIDIDVEFFELSSPAT